MRRIILAVVLFIMALTLPAAAETMRLPLYKLAPVATVDMRCVNAEYTIPIPIPERWQVKKAVLTVSYMNSASLMLDTSQLSVWMNKQPITQRKYSSLVQKGTINVQIPEALMRSGYNELGFKVSQHYQKECEKPCSSELWTTLYLDTAFLEIEYDLKPVPLSVASVAGFMFDPKSMPQGNVNVIMEDGSADTITIASIVTSGIARRFDYRKVYFSVSKDIMPGVDNVVIGKKAFMEAFLRSKGIAHGEIAGPFLKVAHLPVGAKTDRAHGLLVVSGRQHDDLKLASETISNLTISYPGTDEMIATKFTLPEIAKYGGRLMLTADKVYDFKSLNIPTHSFSGYNPSPLEINFRLPADFLIKQNQFSEIVLNFSYGAGMRTDSVLNLMLNGNNIKAIHLSNQSGDMIQDYKIIVPTFLFKAGANTLSFVPVMTPVARECDLVQTGNLFFTLFETSTLKFPAMPHYAELPAMDFFFLNGFPFTRWPDGLNTVVYLPKADPASIAAAFNVIGLITQKNGYPLFSIKIALVEPADWKGEIIVIGDAASIPDRFKQAAPFKLTGASKKALVPYPVIRSWEGEASYAFSEQTGGLGDDAGIFMEFESPYNKGDSVVMLAAQSTDGLLVLSDALLEPYVQARSKGDVILVEFAKPDYRVTSLNVGARYATGKTDRFARIDYFFSSNPYVYQGVVIVIIITTSAAIYALVRRARRKRINDQDENKGGHGDRSH